MIHDVDEAIKLLIKRDVIRGSGDVEVSFEAPSTDWASRRSGPAVNVYLYDIREDLPRRTVEMLQVMSEDDPRITTARRPPARFFKLSYLLTAWTQRPEDEHRLLSSCLGCFLRYNLLPEDVMVGSLATVGSRCLVQIAQPPPGDRSISDIWTALGGELKPSLELRITAPFAIERVEKAAPAVMEEAAIMVQTSTGLHERPRRRRAIPLPAPEVVGQPAALADEYITGTGGHRSRVVVGEAADGSGGNGGSGDEDGQSPDDGEGRSFRVRELPRPRSRRPRA